MTGYTSECGKRVHLRLTEDLHADLKASAARERRTMGAEACFLIERGLREKEKAALGSEA